MEQLTPIDEEPSEDEEPDEDQPITMIPKIMHTAPSPTTDYPPTSNVTSTTTVNNDQHHHHHSTPKHDGESPLKSAEPASVTGPIPEITIEQENEKQSIQHEAHAHPAAETDTTTGSGGGGRDSEVRQIESVL